MYKDKAELFCDFFANQYSLTNNSSILPSVLFKQAQIVISFINFGSNDIAKTIQKLYPNKADGHEISIHMLKICGNSFYKPLQLIFRSCTENRKFSSQYNKMLFPFIRKVIRTLWKVSTLCFCFRFVVRFLNV